MSQTQPSAKGSLVLGAAVAARRHREKGRISEQQLEVRLSGPALALIDQKILIAAWYPIDAFCELMDLNWELGGRRDPEFMRREGERSADRLFDTGIYPQLRFAEEAAKVHSRDDLVRQSRLISSITGSLYNFLQIDVRVGDGEEGNLRIVYENAAPFSEALRYSTEGFMNQINKRQKSAQRWTSERQRPDRIVFEMSMPVRLKR
ncbi:MAG TPA: hypothetical protein VMS55_24880 [Myxococcota bacterium]|nr:hypothetical protein [Myxococcota bacterium]